MKPPLTSVLLFFLVAPAFGAYVGITTTTVPNGTVETSYSGVLKASGGCTPYVWKLVSGSLPVGVAEKASSTTTSLNLAGTPTKAGTYSFTEQVTGCGGHQSRVSYKIVIQSTANHIVDVSWKASTSKDIVGYNIYRAPDATTWKKINVSLIASTLYADSTVANGSTYYYAATAVDVKGQESKKSSAVKVSVP
jgi:hypothetical protein